MREMKDSGVQWIGEIPEDWALISFGYIADVFGRIGFRGYTVEDLVDQGEGPITLSPSNIVDQKLSLNKCSYISWDKYYESPEIQINFGDIILVKTASVGKCAIYSSKELATLNPQLVVLKNLKCNNKYLYYAIISDVGQTPILLDNFGSVIPTITQNSLCHYKIPLPSISEQNIIASFLDSKCAEIDALTADIQKEIETLQEYRKSVITEAVTKGLDPNVEMKDSGTCSIGLIPASWTACKALYCLSMPITDGPHTTPELYDDGIPFVSAEAVSCGNGSIDFNHIRGYISKEFYEECCQKYVPQIDDVYMIKSGATTGRVSIVDTNQIFTIWSPLAVFRVNKSKMLARYLFYMLQSKSVLEQVELSWSFGTQQNIGMRVLERLIVTRPKIDEQKQIVAYLNDKCSEIDSIIADKQKQIETLAEYRKSLIYEYVTGKKEVPTA